MSGFFLKKSPAWFIGHTCRVYFCLNFREFQIRANIFIAINVIWRISYVFATFR